MIELRWKVRQLPDLPGAGLFNRTPERILQYRFDISDTQGVYFINHDDRMSKWADVPVWFEPP